MHHISDLLISNYLLGSQNIVSANTTNATDTFGLIKSVDWYLSMASIIIAGLAIIIAIFAIIVGISFLRKKSILDEVDKLIDKKLFEQIKVYLSLQSNLYQSLREALHTTNEFIFTARELVLSSSGNDNLTENAERMAKSLNKIMTLFQLNTNYTMLTSEEINEVDLAIRSIRSLGDPSSIKYLNYFIDMRSRDSQYKEQVKLASIVMRELEKGHLTYQ